MLVVHFEKQQILLVSEIDCPHFQMFLKTRLQNVFALKFLYRVFIVYTYLLRFCFCLKQYNRKFASSCLSFEFFHW